MIDPLDQLDVKLWNEGAEYDTAEVLGVPVKLIIMPDPGHECGGNYTYGWKITLGQHQYGDFMGHLDTREDARLAKDTLLEQCRVTIEAIRKREADGTDKKGAE